MVEAAPSPHTASLPFHWGYHVPQHFWTKREKPMEIWRKMGLSQREPRAGTWDGREGATQGTVSEYRPEAYAPKFTRRLPAEKATHASLSAWLCLTRKTNRTRSCLSDIMGTPELSPGCGQQENTEGISWSDTAVPHSISLEEPETLRTISSHIFMLQVGKLRPRKRIKLS